MKSDQKVYIADSISLLAGLWLIIAPFVLGFTGTVAATNDLIFGIAIGVVALARILYPENMPRISWLNVVFAAWLILSAFVLPGVSSMIMWNNVLLGLVVVVMDSWSVSASLKGKGVH